MTKKNKAAPKKMGAPTKYKDDLPKKVIDLFMKGYTRQRICLKLKINRSTFQAWIEKYPELAAAVENGLYFSQGHWHEVVTHIAQGEGKYSGGNIRAIEALMSNCFPGEWQRGQINLNAQIETQGKDDMKAVYEAMTAKEHVALKKLKIAEAKMIQKTNNRMKKKET